MEWLSPITGLIAAAVAIPALLILYFLKLKRQERVISSTFLWKRAVQDLQVNAPFQKLKSNILLWLQLAVLALLLLALAQPVLSLNLSPARRFVILIDQSASMRATDVKPSRLDEAKAQARQLVESMRDGRSWRLGDQADEAMVIAFSGRAKVLCNYTSDKPQLLAAIDAVEPTDGQSRLAEAVSVARAFASPVGTEDKGKSSVAPADLELFSDGRIADLGEITMSPEEIKFHAIGLPAAAKAEAGRSIDNVAITAMQSRRSFERPDQITTFAEIANYGPKPATSDVQLSIDGQAVAVQSVTVPGREPPVRGEPGKPGRTAVTFSHEHGAAGVLEVRVAREDPLAADNHAWAILQPPKPLTVALVTEDNPALESALKSCRLARFDVLKPADFAKFDATAESPYDLVVLDRCAPADVPRGSYLVFGSPPTASGATVTAELKNQWVVDWRNRHPVLSFVNMENLVAGKVWKLSLPREATVLAEFGDAPAVAEVRRQGNLFILVGFDVLQSNWPFDAGFVMFCYNVANYVATSSGTAEAASLAVGQPITLQAAPGIREAEVTPPSGPVQTVRSGPSGVVRFGATTRVGVYRVAVKDGPRKTYAVNLMDSSESDLEPAAELFFVGQTVKAQAPAAGKATENLWPWLALVGLAIVLIEWYVYNLKVRL
jgi:hypothetical protein